MEIHILNYRLIYSRNVIFILLSILLFNSIEEMFTYQYEQNVM